ncbi:MAG: glycosyltransferase [Cytophagaceae bacterium]|nr:glycosyltransferase [Cytophagaceae bacterium]
MVEEKILQKPRVALYVDDFLPYTHGWIYRQVSDPVTNVRTVLCHKRSEEKLFSITRFIKSPNGGRLKAYVRGRFWFLFKYCTSSLNKKSTKDFSKELRDQEINLVHAHFGTNGVLIAPLCKELQIPLVVTFHGFDISSAPLRWPAYRKQLQSLFDQIVYAIAISEEMVDRLIKIGCPREKIKVSYLGVPLMEFPFVDRTQRKQSLVFLHAGRLTAKKGVPDLVHAFEKAFSRKEEAELWLVGEGEEEKEVQQVIQSNKFSNVKLLGRLSEEELQQVRSKADVFVLNCRTDEAGTKEGLPISILEACCTGMPVISTYHAGIPESIIHGQTGLLVNEYDNAALTEALIKMSDDAARLTMGKQARAFMEQKFSLAGCNEKLNILYKAALKN